MSEKEKPDLIKIFGLEGQIKPRTILDETKSELNDKTPYQITQEIHIVIELLNQSVVSGDIETGFKCIQAGLLRMTTLQEIMFEINEIANKIKRSRDGDQSSS